MAQLGSASGHNKQSDIFVDKSKYYWLDSALTFAFYLTNNKLIGIIQLIRDKQFRQADNFFFHTSIKNWLSAKYT